MAFESISIQSTRNGSGLTSGYREDLVAGDTIVLSLTSSTGVLSREWSIVGRPEFSTAGGGGSNPWVLSTSATATFTVDSDTGSVARDGTYVVECIINRGSPNETRKRAALVRTAGLTIDAPGATTRNLRKLGMFESQEDTSVSGLLAGWSTQVNRWLQFLKALASGGSGGVSFRGFRVNDPGGAFVNATTRVNLAGAQNNSIAGYFGPNPTGAMVGNATGQMLYAIPEYFDRDVLINRLLTRTNGQTGVVGALPKVKMGIYAEGVRTTGPLAGTSYPGALLASSSNLLISSGNMVLEDVSLSCPIEAGTRVFFVWVCNADAVAAAAAGFIMPVYRVGVLSPPLGWLMDPSTGGASTGITADTLTVGCTWRHAVTYTGSEALPDPFPQSAPVAQVDVDNGVPCVFFGQQYT